MLANLLWRFDSEQHSTIIPLEIWDCPGNITVDTLGAPLSTFALIIFVIDIQAGLVPLALPCILRTVHELTVVCSFRIRYNNRLHDSCSSLLQHFKNPRRLPSRYLCTKQKPSKSIRMVCASPVLTLGHSTTTPTLTVEHRQFQTHPRSHHWRTRGHAWVRNNAARFSFDFYLRPFALRSLL